MKITMSFKAASVLIGSYFAFSEAYALSEFTSIRAMEKVFHRSEKVHQSSMDAITKSLTPEKALALLHAKNKTNTALLQVAELALTKHSSLRAHRKSHKAAGSGLDGAKTLLNDMIFESLTKYDGEIAKCTSFYSSQCSLMTIARGEISASNFLAANSRMHILDSQGTIGRCEDDIPQKKLELKGHNSKCKSEIKKSNARLKIVLGDIAVMTMILKMTDCAKKNMLVQVGLMKCQDMCSKTSFITFKQQALKEQMDKLQSSLSHELSTEAMGDLFNGVEGLETLEFHNGVQQAPAANKTAFNNPPTPRTEVPANPCNDPNGGGPSMNSKRSAKCTITKSPQCYKLQERFLLIQSGIQDERDELLEEIEKMETSCQDTKDTLETQVSDDQKVLDGAQTKLAAATESEANAGESARQTSKAFNGMNKDLMHTMKTCNENYINFETELCALRKIRGELYKMQGGGMGKSFFVDCGVTKWEGEECSKKCAGGTQKLLRQVITHPNGGAKCLPLSAMRSCNSNPCPVNCKLEAWNGWSKCSAQCGGGVQQRLRDVKQVMKFGGKPCSASSETKACNGQACETDCVLSKWSKWSKCSKDCDGGTKRRSKYVKIPAVGEGQCGDAWDKERLQFKACNRFRCKVGKGKKVLECNRKLDVVLLIDGSGSLGKKGWDSEIIAAQNFISAFANKKKAKAMLSVILFSGPKTWSGVSKCTGKSKKPVDMERCGITTVTHFNDDAKRVNQLVLGLEWPKGSTLTSLALATAKAELGLGRKDAKSVVVVFTDGRPMSFRKTTIASTELRKSARLIWVPITARAPLKRIKKWATRRWQENIVLAEDYKTLSSADTVNHIIADMCPRKR